MSLRHLIGLHSGSEQDESLIDDQVVYIVDDNGNYLVDDNGNNLVADPTP